MTEPKAGARVRTRTSTTATKKVAKPIEAVEEVKKEQPQEQEPQVVVEEQLETITIVDTPPTPAVSQTDLAATITASSDEEEVKRYGDSNYKLRMVLKTRLS